MVEPVTALTGATAAFNAIRKGVQVGRDLEGIAKDLSRWRKAKIVDSDSHPSPPLNKIEKA